MNLVLLAALVGLAVLVSVAVWFFVRGSARKLPRSPMPLTVPQAGTSAGAPGPGPQAGGATVVQNVEIRRLIAEGGMGNVYEGFDNALHRKVAVKRMRPEIRADRVGREAFLTEARVVAALQHPNIVQIHSVIDGPEGLYLVFEYIEGLSVYETITIKRKIPLAECRKIVRGVCAALDFAHARKVLHRDLKPGNIMVSDDGQVKVMDFGIARQAIVTLSRLTPGLACGTMAYMSPEQHLGHETRPADLYAVASSLYHMLTGTLPFVGPEHLRQKERMEYLPLSRVLAGMGPREDAFMAKAMAVHPDSRFQRAGEFLEAFEAAFADVPTAR